MSTDELAKWLVIKALRFEGGNDEERHVASILWQTYVSLEMGTLSEFRAYCRVFSPQPSVEEEE